MVLRGILPECFSTAVPRDGGDHEATTAQIEDFNSGGYNNLYTLRCRCSTTGREAQASEARSSPPVLLQASCRTESQLPLGGSNPHAPSAYTFTLLHHRGDSEGDQFDTSHIPGEILLRLSLPLDPYFHMESGVATAHFARVRGIPVPRVYAYDSSAINCLGLEWQLVQKIPDVDANFFERIREEEEEALVKCGRKTREVYGSAAWMRLGRQLEDTLGLLRSPGGQHPGRGRSSNRDFFIGPVSSGFFVDGRRLLYHQRQDEDGGDPALPLLRGPFRTVGGYLNAKLAIILLEVDDKTLRSEDEHGEPIVSSETGRLAADGTAATPTTTPAALSDPDFSWDGNVDPERTWYRKVHVDKVRDQVFKIRDVVLPWIEANLRPGQRERMRTFISHPDLHSENLLVSRRARALNQSEDDRDVMGEEYAITAVLDWEHTVALPDYFIEPVKVVPFFRALPDIKYCPWPEVDLPVQVERLLGEAGNGGSAVPGPWPCNYFFALLEVPGGLVPCRQGDDGERSDGRGAAGSANGSSRVEEEEEVLGGGRDVRLGEAAGRWAMAPPRALTNAEVLLHFICSQLKGVVGHERWNRSESWVDPCVEKIQAHIASGRATEQTRERSEGM